VTLLGDAAHAATPNLGRGGSEGLEDSAVLADLLVAHGGLAGDPIAALRVYEAQRRPATARIQTMGWRIGKMLSISNPAFRAVRDRGFKWFAGRGMAKDMDKEFASLSAAYVRDPRTGAPVG
jgi:2-polyprenyl-6-methoxyphenol hydroxylase-like FAD-dependent oxidoreductase